MISEDLARHIESGANLINNEFRYGSTRWAEIICEARRMYRLGVLDDISIEDYEILESDIGEPIGFNGETVLLEVPYPVHDDAGTYYVYVLDDETVQKIFFTEHQAQPV